MLIFNRLLKPMLTIMLFAQVYPVFADMTMGVFPRRSIAATYKAFFPLSRELSNALGEKVKLVVPKDFKAFWEGVKNKKFDLVHFNQYHYLLGHKGFGYNVIVSNEEFGNRTISGALVVRKDSGIKSLQDLKGKTIIFGGGKKAMGSYIGPTYMLKQAGLTGDEDYRVKFAKNPPAAVVKAFKKFADAAGSGDVILSIGAVKKKVDTSELMILAKTKPFTHLPWAVKSGMSADKIAKIKSTMTGLKKSEAGIKILKAAKVTDFYAVTDADFGDVRKIVKSVTGEDL